MGCDFYNSEQRVGRKDYACQLCMRVIPKGTEHIYESGKFDGNYFSHRRHIHCDAILRAFWDEWSEDEYDEQEVYDFIREACFGCEKWHEDECEEDPFWCRKVIETLLEGTDRMAALESAGLNREGEA